MRNLALCVFVALAIVCLIASFLVLEHYRADESRVAFPSLCIVACTAMVCTTVLLRNPTPRHKE